ncbi:hypothetical protein WEH80_07610 [Actinomycetes bacterium KLBMP 9759]
MSTIAATIRSWVRSRSVTESWKAGSPTCSIGNGMAANGGVRCRSVHIPTGVRYVPLPWHAQFSGGRKGGDGIRYAEDVRGLVPRHAGVAQW